MGTVGTAGAEELEQVNLELRARVRELAATQALLRRGEEYFRALIENGSEVLAVLRPDGRVRYHSPSAQRVLGYDASSTGERGFASLLHEADVPRAVETFTQLLGCPGRTARIVLRMRHADGGHRHMEAVLRNLVTHPAVGGVVVVARDVTDRVEFERTLREKDAQLRHSQKMEAVGRLAGGLAHDFNNILTVIGGHAEYLAKALPGEGSLGSDVDGILDAVERAARLTRQLLTFSRCDMASPRLLSLTECVVRMQEMARRLLPRTVRLTARLESGRWHVRADPGHLEQVVMNLLVNARDAVGERGDITVATHEIVLDTPLPNPFGEIPPGRYVVLSVGDTGCGMEPDTLDHIFDPFFSTKGAAGTGLGLSTVFGIVQDAGGFITVDTRPGAGSRFRCFLPAFEPGPPEAASEGEDLADAVATGETILYVEDEDPLRALTTRALRESGYQVLAAAAGEDALDLAALYADAIDLLLSDVVMPGMTGPDLHARLEETRGRVPALFLSGYPGEELVRHGLRDAPLLRKPYAGRELLRAVRRTLDDG